MTYKPTKNDVLTLSIYNGSDHLDNSRVANPGRFGGQGGGGFNFSVNDLTDWGNLGSSFKWSHKFSPTFYMNTLVSYSTYYSQRDRSQDGSVTDSLGARRTIKNGTLENNNLKDFSYKMDFGKQTRQIKLNSERG